MSLTLALELPLSPAEAFELLVAELERATPDIGMQWRDGRLLEGDIEVATLQECRPGERIALSWRAADWRDERTEVELRFEPAGEGTRVVLEHRGWGAALAGPNALAGWFAGRALAPLLAATGPAALAAWLTDRAARRPAGSQARANYRAPKEHQYGFDVTLAALGLRPGDALLEVGCGGGAFIRQALAACARAVAVDHSPEMVALTAETNADAVAAGRLEVCQADAAALPLPDGAFSAYAMTHAFFFMEDPVGALSEARRVLAPDGRAAVFTTGPELRGTPAAPEPVARFMRLYTAPQLEALAREAGFGAVEVHEHGGARLLLARP